MPETCRVLQQNKIWIISASGWLFKKKSITMHGNMNVKFNKKEFLTVLSDGNRDKYMMECNNRRKTRRHCVFLRKKSTKILEHV